MTKKHRNDLILFSALLCVGIIALSVAIALTSGNGETVVVTVDGKETLRVPLEEPTEFLIEGYDGGKNLLVIKDGTAKITEADCPEQICVKTGNASEIKSIVCAHNRVVVSIEKE
ncbi:MAG: NusG domain II-containing protein [Clostridia bacterium]|nr:NusG domain II-containing protein [Clostridia bacterium]